MIWKSDQMNLYDFEVCAWGLSVCLCDPVSAEGITGDFSNGNCDFVMKMEVCKSDLEMEHVIFIYTREGMCQKIDKLLDLLVTISLGSLEPPNISTASVDFYL